MTKHLKRKRMVCKNNPRRLMTLVRFIRMHPPKMMVRKRRMNGLDQN